jgi:hypothetical protein
METDSISFDECKTTHSATHSDCTEDSEIYDEQSAQLSPRGRVCAFLKQHSSYDVLPVSYRIIVFDTSLLVKKALAALMQNGKRMFDFGSW